jgi:hypothetical protein
VVETLFPDFQQMRPHTFFTSGKNNAPWVARIRLETVSSAFSLAPG